MSKNGKHAAATVATADEPADLYDSLTQAEQDIHDQIGTLGYVPYKGSTGLWLAKKRAGKSQIAVGPANDLNDLLSRVKDDIADFGPSDEATDNAEVSTELDEGETLLTEDHKGNTYLPGVEQVVDQQLKDAAFNEYTDKQAWNEAGKKKKESKAALEAMVAAKRHLFYEDPAKKSDLIYKVGGLTIRCAKEYSVKVKTEQTEDDDE